MMTTGKILFLDQFDFKCCIFAMRRQPAVLNRKKCDGKGNYHTLLSNYATVMINCVVRMTIYGRTCTES